MPGIPGTDRPKTDAAAIYGFQKEARNRAAASDFRQTGLFPREVEVAGFIAVAVKVLAQLPQLTAEFKGVLTADPRHQVVGDVGRSRRQVSGVQAGALAVGGETIAEADLRRIVMTDDTGNLRYFAGGLEIDTAITLVPVQIPGREMVKQGRAKRVIPVEAVHPGVLRVGEGFIGQLQRQNRVEFCRCSLPPDGKGHMILGADILVEFAKVVVRTRENGVRNRCGYQKIVQRPGTGRGGQELEPAPRQRICDPVRTNHVRMLPVAAHKLIAKVLQVVRSGSSIRVEIRIITRRPRIVNRYQLSARVLPVGKVARSLQKRRQG